MTTLSGATHRLHERRVARIGRYGIGVGSGRNGIALPTDHDRVPRAVFPPEVRAQTTTLACSRPQSVRQALAHWSYAELAQQMIALGQVTHIAPSTVWRWLTADKIKPWRYHSWQHIVEPATFLVRARPVLQLYAQAQDLLAQGFWVVCVDEKTSIQARQREQPPRPPNAAHPGQVSPRYRRRGAIQLFAGLSVADGQVYGQCRCRKRLVDFQAFITTVIVPAAIQRGVHRLALILDNGPTHAPKRLEAWLREQGQKHAWPFTIQVYWLPKNASWLDQIEIWFSVLQRKLLRPVHFDSVQVLVKCITAFIRRYNRTAKPIHWSYTVQKLELKLGMD